MSSEKGRKLTAAAEEDLRGSIHGVTHNALPPAKNTNAGVKARASIQVEIADGMMNLLRRKGIIR